MTQDPLLDKALAALPPRLAGLFETGLLAIDIREGPEPRQPYAFTAYRRGSYRFTIVLDAHAVAAASEATLRGMLRHELAHIFLGHFGPEHEQCRLPCNLLAEEAEVNYYLGEDERAAVEELFTALSLQQLTRRLGDAIPMPLLQGGFRASIVDPDQVRAMAGLAPDLPPLWRWVHPLLHPMEKGPQRGPGNGAGSPGGPMGPGAGGEGEEEAAFPCGGVQVDEDAMDEAMGVAAALAASPRGQEARGEALPRSHGWGDGAGATALRWEPPFLPPWAQQLLDWARGMARRVWAIRRVRWRPRIDYLRATGVYRPDRGYERVRERGEVAFVLDTSGSMAEDFHYAHPAIAFLLHHGVAVRFVCGDVRVEVDVLLRPGDEIPAPKGGGGTDICPLVEQAASYRPDGICIFTDAEIPRWPDPPEGARVLWIIPEGCRPPYGEAAHWQPSP